MSDNTLTVCQEPVIFPRHTKSVKNLRNVGPMKNALITGSAGFIGFHLTRRLLDAGLRVVGVDNLNDYYDVSLKRRRLELLLASDRFVFSRSDITSADLVRQLFQEHRPEVVVNLAAQAGVRYSLQNPRAYIDSNLVGFLNILECCRHFHVKHLVYASSSSVYGTNAKLPFSVNDSVDHPVSLYAATKKANELMAHCYSHLFGLPTTGLRFFTVYGPWGRPDMAYFQFTRAILENKSIDVFNQGNMKRDFTYIDDIVQGIERVMHRIPVCNPDWTAEGGAAGSSTAPYRIYNIGNNQPVNLMHFIGALEKALGRKARINFLPMQAGDVPATFADIADLERDIGFRPSTPLEVGIERFVDWYRGFYRIEQRLAG
jgi:UDP-glucuronate 4-epimerase